MLMCTLELYFSVNVFSRVSMISIFFFLFLNEDFCFDQCHFFFFFGFCFVLVNVVLYDLIYIDDFV